LLPVERKGRGRSRTSLNSYERSLAGGVQILRVGVA
jgi:hypothetical protein